MNVYMCVFITYINLFVTNFNIQLKVACKIITSGINLWTLCTRSVHYYIITL